MRIRLSGNPCGRARGLAVLPLGFLAFTPWMLCAADDTPGWLKELTGVALPAYAAKVNSVVLLNEERTVVDASRRLTTTTRTAVKILNSQGGGIVFFDTYDAPSGKVRDFRAWMVSPSGRVKK